MPALLHDFVDGNKMTGLYKITRTEYIVPLWEKSYFPQNIS